MQYNQAEKILSQSAGPATSIANWQEWKSYKRACPQGCAWVYLILFSTDVFAWGTASTQGTRLRYMSLMHPRTSGKYDRRVDYFMLRRLYGNPLPIQLFCFADNQAAKNAEDQLRALNGQRACFGGLRGDRPTISLEILSRLKSTPYWQKLNLVMKDQFTYFVTHVLSGRTRVYNKRTWHFGDVLEPGGLERFGLSNYRDCLEAILDIEIPAGNSVPQGATVGGEATVSKLPPLEVPAEVPANQNGIQVFEIYETASGSWNLSGFGVSVGGVNRDKLFRFVIKDRAGRVIKTSEIETAARLGIAARGRGDYNNDRFTQSKFFMKGSQGPVPSSAIARRCRWT